MNRFRKDMVTRRKEPKILQKYILPPSPCLQGAMAIYLSNCTLGREKYCKFFGSVEHRNIVSQRIIRASL